MTLILLLILILTFIWPVALVYLFWKLSNKILLITTITIPFVYGLIGALFVSPQSGTLKAAISFAVASTIVTLFVLWILCILIGGFKWIRSRKNQEEKKKAKKYAIVGILGIICLVLYFVLVNFILTAWNPHGGRTLVIPRDKTETYKPRNYTQPTIPSDAGYPSVTPNYPTPTLAAF